MHQQSRAWQQVSHSLLEYIWGIGTPSSHCLTATQPCAKNRAAHYGEHLAIWQKEAGRNVAEGIARVLRYRTGAMGESWFGSECAHCASPVSYQNACSLHPSFTLSCLESLSFLEVCSGGFFDAEGCIYIDRGCNSVQLIIGQRDAPVLVAIQQFWMKQLPLGHETRLYPKKHAFHLVSTRTGTSIIILERLLEHGLQNKSDAALSAVQGNSLSHSDLRRHVGNHQGKHCYFSRLDEDGCRRAKLTKNLRSRLGNANAKANGAAAAESLHAELCLAKMEHNVRNAQTCIIKLRELIATIEHMRTQTVSLWSQSLSVISG